MAVEKEQAERAIEAFLRALGRNPDQEPELRGTASRVVDAWVHDLLDGYGIDPGALLEREAFPLGNARPSLITVFALEVCTMCPHHLLPARGTADVAFWPGSQLVGLGVIARLVDAWSHRLSLQESIGQNVVESLMDHLGARGAACRLRLSHSCMTARGVRQTGSLVETVALGGCFEDSGPERELMLSSLNTR